jgi:hypothetical protein
VAQEDGPWVGRLLSAGWVVVGSMVVLAAIETIRTGFAPLIDNALIASATVDSLSLDPPLVGMPSSLSLDVDSRLSHPGPLGFWLLAVPTKVFGEPGDGLVVGALLLSLASVAALAVLVRRRRDVVLEGVFLVLVGAMITAIGGPTFVSPFNPYVGILPYLVCMVATWGVLSGRHRQMWVAIAAGSVSAQVHLGYVPLVGVLVLLCLAGVVLDAVRSPGELRRRLLRRVLPVSLGLGVLLWIGPIVDQVAGSGNLVDLVRSSTGGGRPTVGWDHGLDVAVEMTSLPPRWLLGHARDESLADPGTGRILLSLLTVATMAGLFVVSLRRRDRSLASLVVVAATSALLATAGSARLVAPETDIFFAVEEALLYRLFWWPVGVVVALTVVWGLLRAASPVGGDELAARLRPARVPLVGGLVLVGVVLGLVWRTEPTDLGDYVTREQGNAAAIAGLPGHPDEVVFRLRPEGEVPAEGGPGIDRPPDVWDLGPDGQYGYLANLVAQLRLRGIAVRFADEPSDGTSFMRAYREEHRARGDEDVELLYLVGARAVAPPPPGYRVVSTSGDAEAVATDPLAVPAVVLLRTDDG